MDRAGSVAAKALSPSGRQGAAAGSSAPDFQSVKSIRQSLICLNPEQTWKVGYDGNLEVYDLYFTFLHEIGHTIGLDHPGASGEVMGFRYDEKVRDASGRRYRGGAPPLWRAPAGGKIVLRPRQVSPG